MQTDIKGHFNLNSCSHGVKIEVKQVDDNYTWLYKENQYLCVELSDFLNSVPKSIVSHSFSGIDISLGCAHIHILSGHIYINNGIITD